MIRLTADEHGVPHIEQWAARPIVYLDHWALRKFSDSSSLSSCLATCLHAKNGTLALSWVNLGEFSKVTPPEQARNAEKLIELNLPRLFFMEVEPSHSYRPGEYAAVGAQDRSSPGGPWNAEGIR